MGTEGSHKQAVTEIRRYIAAIGGYSWLLPQSQRLYGSKGLPDMYCIVANRAFWIEIKVGKDKLRPAQAAFKLAAEKAGVPVVVGRAADVVDKMEEWGRNYERRTIGT